MAVPVPFLFILPVPFLQLSKKVKRLGRPDNVKTAKFCTGDGGKAIGTGIPWTLDLRPERVDRDNEDRAKPPPLARCEPFLTGAWCEFQEDANKCLKSNTV